MSVIDTDPGLTVKDEFAQTAPHSVRSPVLFSLPRRNLQCEINNYSWIKPSPRLILPDTSISWQATHRSQELDEDFHVPFRAKKTVRAMHQIRYVGRFQTQSLDLEEYDLD